MKVWVPLATLGVSISCAAAASMVDDKFLLFVFALLVINVVLVLLALAGQALATGVVSGMLSTVGFAAYFIFPKVAAHATTSANLPVSDLQLRHALLTTLSLAALSGLTGLLLVRSGAQERASGEPRGRALATVVESTMRRPSLHVLPAVALVLGIGPLAVLSRSGYQELTGPRAVFITGYFLSVFSVIAAGRMCVGRSRRFAIALVLLYALLYFSIATRLLAAIPVLVVLGLAAERGRVPIKFLVVSILAGIELLHFPLLLRQSSTHGVLAYGHALASAPLSDLINPDLAGSLGNIFFSLPLTAFVAAAGPIAPSAFWVSVNPLPSFLTNWQEVSRSLNVNSSTPYNGLGELLNYGLLFAIGYVVVVASLLAIQARILAQLPTALLRSLARGLQLGVAVLYVLNLQQYNLRSGTRLIYYGLALSLVLRLVGSRNSQERSPT